MSNTPPTKGTPKQGMESDSGIASRRAEDDSLQPCIGNEYAAFENPLPKFDTALVFTDDQMKSLSRQSSRQSKSTEATATKSSTGTNQSNESLVTAVHESGEDSSVPSPIQTDTQDALKAEIARLQDDNQRLRLELAKSTEVELSETITQRFGNNEDQILAYN